jgi:hypothetical protein
MLRGGVGGQPHAGADEQDAQPAADVAGRPLCREPSAQALVPIGREDPSSVCVCGQHVSVLFST